MVTLIIPAARDGPEHLKGMPAWLSVLPNGNLALAEMLHELDCTNVAHIVFITLQSHVARFLAGSTTALEHVMEKAISRRCVVGTAKVEDSGCVRLSVVALDSAPVSAPDTVRLGLRAAQVADDAPIFIKDSDGSFVHRIEAGNCVVGMPISHELSAVQFHGLLAKSFLQRTGALLTNIVEKQLVSDTIAVGGYGFRAAKEFITALEEMEVVQHHVAQSLSTPTRLFVSNIIQRMLYKETAFSVALTSRLEDWKTETSWENYLSSFRNIVMSVEASLLVPPTAAAVPSLNILAGISDIAAFAPMESAIDHLTALKARHGRRCHVVLLSRLPHAREPEMRRALQSHSIPFDALVMGTLGASTVILGGPPVNASRGTELPAAQTFAWL